MRNPLTFEALAEWLSKQPPGQEYEYYNFRGCAICKYLDFVGIEYNSAGSNDWAEDGVSGRRHRICADDTVADKPHTFGAAAERAKRALASDNRQD